jgi:hypothetical protein
LSNSIRAKENIVTAAAVSLILGLATIGGGVYRRLYTSPVRAPAVMLVGIVDWIASARMEGSAVTAECATILGVRSFNGPEVARL